MRRSPRRGLTLFQLLVVLALLLILLGMLLPALAKARLAATRMQSANNLKQLGLACHNHHDATGRLPPGDDANHFSAAAHLLPYLEQDAVYRLIDFKKPADDKANATVRGLRIKVFLNPMDPLTTVRPDSGATNYLFVAGAKVPLADNDGVFYRDSKCQFGTITDGLSNTLMAVETLKGDGGERAADLRRQHVRLKADALKGLKPDAGVQEWKDGTNIVGDRCASWLDGRFLQGTFTGTRALNDPRPDVDCGGAGGLSGVRSPGDQGNVLLCDGSVRAIGKRIDPKGWQYLSARNDGNVVPNF